jgi:hypothetical protein
MFVRGRIGTNAFIEQASAEAEVLSVEISARVLNGPIPANDTATIVVTVTPQRTIYSLAIGYFRTAGSRVP